MNAEWLDEEGVYPTDEALKKIEKWPWEDITGCFAFIKDIWAYADSGYWVELDTINDTYDHSPVHRYHISTAGWSGNEDIIRALQKNYIIWFSTWVQSRRGGHYIFELKSRGPVG